MTVRISKNSRLRFAPLVTLDGYEFWDMLVIDGIPVRSDEIQYTVQQHDRIDTLANQFYGDPILWWVLAVANGFEMLPNDLKVGGVIRVPSRAYVFSDVLARQVAVF